MTNELNGVGKEIYCVDFAETSRDLIFFECSVSSRIFKHQVEWECLRQ